jgi:hypothetical protein
VRFHDFVVGLALLPGASAFARTIADHDAAYLRPSFGTGQDGIGTIAGGTALVSLTTAF